METDHNISGNAVTQGKPVIQLLDEIVSLYIVTAFKSQTQYIDGYQVSILEENIAIETYNNYILLFSIGASHGNVEFLFPITLMFPTQIVTMTSTSVSGLILLDVLGPERRIMIM